MSPVEKADTVLIKCTKHVKEANISSSLSHATTFHYDFITVNKAWFTLKLTHITQTVDKAYTTESKVTIEFAMSDKL